MKVGKQRDSTFAGWVTNPGNGILSINNVELDGTNKDQFQLVNPPLFPVLVPGGQSFSFRVRFKPTTDGYKTAKLKITNNASAAPKEIAINGAGGYPAYTSLLTRVVFDTTGVNGGFRSKPFPMLNDGAVEVELQKMEITGGDSTDFKISYWYPHAIAVSDTYFVWIDFRPTKMGLRRSTLRIHTDTQTSPESVQLEGRGGVLNDIAPQQHRDDFILLNNYPNPFTDHTVIRFRPDASKHSSDHWLSSSRSEITLKIFDLFGREILDLSDAARSDASITLQRAQLPCAGVYYYRLAVGKQIVSRMMLMH